MSKFRPEDLLNNVKSLLVMYLNNKIDAIESEQVTKGLPATNLAHVDPTKGYFLQSWSDKAFALSPAIFYGIEDIKSEGFGPATKQEYRVFVEVVYVDSLQDLLVNARIFRYAEAIKEVFEEHYADLSNSAKIKIETVRPVSFKLDTNTSEEVRVGGVSLITSLA
jgi:hypothetical protein